MREPCETPNLNSPNSVIVSLRRTLSAMSQTQGTSTEHLGPETRWREEAAGQVTLFWDQPDRPEQPSLDAKR